MIKKLLIPVTILGATTNVAKAQNALQDITTPTTLISSYNGVSNPSRILNNNVTSSSDYASFSTSSSYIIIDLGSSKPIQGYSITAQRYSSLYNWSWIIEGSNNSSNWTIIDNRSSSVATPALNQKVLYKLNNTGSYRYIRVRPNSSNNSRLNIFELELFSNFTISGNVFNDKNANGVKDAGENGINGVKVWLKKIENSTVNATTTTDNNGNYSFNANLLDGMTDFIIAIKPKDDYQIRSERYPQPLGNFPTIQPDGVFFYSNRKQAGSFLYSTINNGIFNFGLALPTLANQTNPTISSTNINLITNEFGGSFGNTDSTDANFIAMHPNFRLFNTASILSSSLYTKVTDYNLGINYSFPTGSTHAGLGYLILEGKYLITNVLGTVYIENTTQFNHYGSLNYLNGGWRSTTGSTTGSWNDRFLVVNGSTISGNTNNLIFADTVSLIQDIHYSMGFFGKSANKWLQGAEFAKPSVINYEIIRLGGSNSTVASGTLTVTPSMSLAEDSILANWDKSVTNFKAPAAGNYAIRYYVTGRPSQSGNDVFLDDFFLFRSSYRIIGTVYNDGNGNSDNAINGVIQQNIENKPLYAYLLDSVDNRVISKSIVSSNGTYELLSPDYLSYNVVISTSNHSNGEEFIDTAMTNWERTGMNFGGNNAKGTGITNGAFIPVKPANNNLMDIVNVDFGLNKRPESFDRSMTILGNNAVNVHHVLDPLRGADLEDNNNTNVDWNNRSLVITSLPTNGYSLFYDNTIITDPNTRIDNYDPSKLTIAIMNGNGTSGTQITSFQYATIDNADMEDLTPATYTINFAQPLPIQISYFNVFNQDNKGIIEWETSTEINNKGFFIQKSKDGKSWDNLNFVTSKAEEGNSSEIIHYNDIDNNLFNGMNFYRLAQLDLDGLITYSMVKSIKVQNVSSISIAPNPASNFITIKNGTKATTINVININGQIIKTFIISEGTQQVSIQDLASGTYLIKYLHQDEVLETFKLIKQ